MMRTKQRKGVLPVVRMMLTKEAAEPAIYVDPP